MESVVPPARSIYIASCRLSSLFRRKFRGKDASVAAFSDPAIVMRAACLLDYVMYAHSCCSRIGSSRSGEATTHPDSHTPNRRAGAVRLGRSFAFPRGLTSNDPWPHSSYLSHRLLAYQPPPAMTMAAAPRPVASAA